MSIGKALRRPLRQGYFNATLWIIAVNILCFVAELIFPRLKVYMALNPALTLSGFVWQPVTYMFAHSDISHLAVNMLGLFMFGTQVERAIGSREFLLYYMLTGILAGLFSLIVYIATDSWYVMLLGASGALFAVLLAFAVLYPDARVFLWGIIPLRAPVMVIGYTVVEIASQLFSFRESVAHLTHLAGFGFGWLYFVVRFGVNPAKRLIGKR